MTASSFSPGITVTTAKEARIAVSNALQCGSDAVVISFARHDCSDAAAITATVKQVRILL